MNKNLIVSLMKDGVVTIPSFLFQYYKRIGLSDIECMLILHLQIFLEEGNEFPTHEQLSSRMLLDTDQCSQTLASLIQRGYLAIEKGRSDTGIYYEKYSLDPLWNKLADYLLLQEKEMERERKEEEEQSIYTIFEQEFGRPLSPIECETIAMWLDEDGHSTTIIKTALKEAVLSGKRNFRYIDRILFEWKKNGIQTVEQALEHGKKFRMHQHKTKPDVNKKKDSSNAPFYNWLES
ncbi:DnaD domain-containing protein [Fervidibacillus halotolerans]|uniref:DnaD domain-containing protein n=1 Tax=Fervidibacillus halotolerans TaxID=2980027 RepID=A0A9E8M1E0_9BACI|nr:DnaD domain-containing protein [Fervidibacillus halotolerans]WAA13733.1 DnaD domain-containing protein [Fervidibacillus halotolerans]